MTLSRALKSVVTHSKKSLPSCCCSATMGQLRRVDSTAAAATFLPLRLAIWAVMPRSLRPMMTKGARL